MKPKLTPRILKYMLIASVVVAVSYALIWIVLQGYSAAWTGFGDFTRPDGEFVRGKTLWDWMQLFIIPIFLSIGVFLLNRSERNLERETAAESRHEAALQAYLDRMTDLLFKEKLRTSENEEVRDVARVRTLSILRGLDSRRKRMVILFLKEANLIAQEPIINLAGADLRKVDLSFTNLSGANLSNTDLSEANLFFTNLSGTNLRIADLSKADLGIADLSKADLSYATLTKADLRDVVLTDATLRGAKLKGALILVALLATARSLEGATMPDGTKHD